MNYAGVVGATTTRTALSARSVEGRVSWLRTYSKPGTNEDGLTATTRHVERSSRSDSVHASQCERLSLPATLSDDIHRPHPPSCTTIASASHRHEDLRIIVLGARNRRRGYYCRPEPPVQAQRTAGLAFGSLTPRRPPAQINLFNPAVTVQCVRRPTSVTDTQSGAPRPVNAAHDSNLQRHERLQS